MARGKGWSSTIPPTGYAPDLKKDPYQLNNAYNNPQYSKVIKEMKDEILKKRMELKDDDLAHPEMADILEKYWD